MAKTQLARTGLSQWSSDTDAWPARAGFNAENQATETKVAVYSQGLYSARPAASAAQTGRFYWATDTDRLFYDEGGTWVEVSPVGGGGAPVTLDIGDGQAEGSSRIAARADHQHPFPVPAVDPAASTYGGTADRGVSATVARADHKHALAALPLASQAPAAVKVGGAGVIGVNTNLARQDHTHALAAPDLDPGQVVPGGAGDRGTSETPARADHTHLMPALPLATSGQPPTGIEIGDSLIVGTSTSLARADHQHPFPAPSSPPGALAYGQTGATGGATTAARSDHTHTLPSLVLNTTGSMLAGTAPGSATLLRAVPIMVVVQTGGTGRCDITLPFANGLFTADVMNGDAQSNANFSIAIYLPGVLPGNLALLIRTGSGTPAALADVRICGTAWGW